MLELARITAGERLTLKPTLLKLPAEAVKATPPSKKPSLNDIAKEKLDILSRILKAVEEL